MARFFSIFHALSFKLNFFRLEFPLISLFKFSVQYLQYLFEQQFQY